MTLKKERARVSETRFQTETLKSLCDWLARLVGSMAHRLWAIDYGKLSLTTPLSDLENIPEPTYLDNLQFVAKVRVTRD